MPSVARRILVVGVLVLAVLACNFPSLAPPSTPDIAQTSVAQTVAAAVSQTFAPVLPVSPLPSVSSAPAADTLTPIPTLSPTIAYTTTPSTPMISVSVNTNCRLGPGKVYEPPVGGLMVGQTAQVYARNPEGDYWYIRLPNTDTYCWVWGQYATLVGNTSVLPVYTAIPTPTPVPDFVLSYAGLDSCVGWWVELKMKNIGPIAFKSYSLTVKDTNTSTVLTNSANGFTNLGGCMTSSIIASLDPGDSYTLSAPAFVYNPNNHKIRTTLTLYSGLNQTGVAVTHTIEFKP